MQERAAVWIGHQQVAKQAFGVVVTRETEQAASRDGHAKDQLVFDEHINLCASGNGSDSVPRARLKVEGKGISASVPGKKGIVMRRVLGVLTLLLFAASTKRYPKTESVLTIQPVSFETTFTSKLTV